ncbi:MAG: NUDIX domain-containing protein [Candidatus Thorarchaeota archaeon]|jgi:ADP-ribose pyrophosphatase YjhB (NUDIX family)
MYKNPAPTIDIIITDSRRVVLVKRGREPYKGKWVFPGGFIDYGEPAEDAAVREALEETNMKIELVDILGVYSAPDRDPRSHHVNIVFIAKPIEGDPIGGDDAVEAKWVDIENWKEGDLAFDHDLIASDFKDWLLDNSKTFWSTMKR